MRTRGFWLVVAAGLLWGGGGTLGTLLGSHGSLHPLSVAFWRLLLGGAVLVLGLAVAGKFRPGLWTRPMWKRIGLMALLTATFQSLYFSAVNFSSVGLATVIAIGSVPAWVALMDWLSTRNAPSRRMLAVLALALGGLVLLMAGSVQLGVRGGVGALLALLVGATFGGITMLNRMPVPGLGAVELTGASFTIGGLIVAPFAFTAGFSAPQDLQGWVLALALGVGSTALAYVCFLRGLRTVAPFVAGVLVLIEPLVGALLGALVLHERLGAGPLLGAAMLLTAVILLRPQRESTSATGATPRIVKAQAGKAE